MFRLLATLMISLQTTLAFAAFDQNHSKFTELLSKFVVVKGPISVVKYEDIKKDPSLLKAYMSEVQAVSKDEYNKFTDAQKKAFLINAYNAYTIDLIIRNYPVKSIKDLGSVFSSAWKRKEWKLLGQDVNLDNIEHDMARGGFKEPRFHMAFVCASIGCPQLRSEAFTADKLETQLEDAARKFLSDTSRNRYNKDKNTLEISSIFKWYRDDFEQSKGGLYGFLADRIASDPEGQKKIRETSPPIRFLPYDWNLNVVK